MPDPNTCAGNEVFVCSHQELCESQLDAAIEDLLSCEEAHTYETDVPAECD